METDVESFAKRTVREAGAIVLEYFRRDLDVENKREESGGYDPVTVADRAAEALMRQAIEAAYPSHGILGEEFGTKSGTRFTWVIDPIDGTRAFMMGMVHWGVLLGLLDEGRPVLGCMYQPYVDELFWGNGSVAELLKEGRAARRLRTSDCTSLGAARLATTSPVYFRSPDEARAFSQLSNNARLARYGGDCYIYAMLAMGFVDVATDASLNVYDIAPLVPIVEGAGGSISCADGTSAAGGGFVVASANEQLHREVLESVRTSAS